MDELVLLNGIFKFFACSTALCFTETWLNDSIPDSSLLLSGFRADHTMGLSGKLKSGENGDEMDQQGKL